MKLIDLQINDYGKFSNKNITFSNSLNIVKGNNESGKSTTLNFIVDMLYGISSDRRKAGLTNYDKYKPWQREGFSGKIVYSLDDGKKYGVFRDFNKKNPVVYNENGEDITKEFTVNKNGVNFFEEQTGIDKTSLVSTVVSKQSDVVLEQSVENSMIQRVANIAETGDDKTSYEKAVKKLKEKKLEEIGSSVSKNKPLNLLNSEVKNLNAKKEELEKYSEELYSLDSRKSELKTSISKSEDNLRFAKRINEVEDATKGYNDRIKILEEDNKARSKEIEEITKNRDELKKKEDSIQQQLDVLYADKAKNEDEARRMEEEAKNKKIRLMKVFGVLAILFLIADIILFIDLKIIPINIILTILIAFSIVFIFVLNAKSKKTFINADIGNESKMIEELEGDIEKVKESIKNEEYSLKFNENEIEKNKDNIKILEESIKRKRNDEIIDIKKEFLDVIDPEEFDHILNSSDISKDINAFQSKINEGKVELSKIDSRKEDIVPKLDELASCEERLENVNEELELLDKKRKSIDIALEVLEDAYKEMKENVTPKFTKGLSNTISRISNGKYNKIYANDEHGIVVEKDENGELINAENLSIGTIDQLYMALRFALADENTKESLPLILDESFVYYDNERLESILRYISEDYKDKQVVIFTCTNRETDILDKRGIKYNLISL